MFKMNVICLFISISIVVIFAEPIASQQNSVPDSVRDSIRVEVKPRNLETIVLVSHDEKFPAKLTYTYDDEPTATVYEPRTIKTEFLYELANSKYLAETKSSKHLISFSAVHEDYCELKCFKNFYQCNAFSYDTMNMACSLYELSHETDAVSHHDSNFKKDFERILKSNSNQNVEKIEDEDEDIEQPIESEIFFKIYRGFKQTFIIRARVNQSVLARVNLIKRTNGVFQYIGYNLNRFKIAPKFYLNYDTETFKAINKSDEFSFVENYINCATDVNQDLIEAIYPMFRKSNEKDFKKLPKLMKPLTDDFSGLYKCRMIIKKTDGIASIYDTKEIYLDVVENEKYEEAPTIVVDTSELSTSMIVKISWKGSKHDLLWENVRRIKLLYYVNDEPYGLVLKSMFTKSNQTITEPSLTSPARDTSECALLCLTNDECQHFEFNQANKTCYLAYSIKSSKTSRRCEIGCYEIRKKQSQFVSIKIAPYHTYAFQLAVQDRLLKWTKYAKSKDIAYMEPIGEDPFRVTMLPKASSVQYYQPELTMHLHCKSSLLKNTVSLDLRSNAYNQASRETSLNEGGVVSLYQEKSIAIFINQYYVNQYNSQEYLNYTCIANFNDLDVYPYEYSTKVANFVWQLKQRIQTSFQLTKQFESSYLLSWTIEDDTSMCIEYRPKFYMSNGNQDISYSMSFDNYQEFLLNNGQEVEFKSVKLDRSTKNGFIEDCALKCLDSFSCKGYLYRENNNSCLHFEKTTSNNMAKSKPCENCVTESYNLEWLNGLCDNCFGTVKSNIQKTGSVELFIKDRNDQSYRIRAQVKCANPQSEVWSWPVETGYF